MCWKTIRFNQPGNRHICWLIKQAGNLLVVVFLVFITGSLFGKATGKVIGKNE